MGTILQGVWRSGPAGMDRLSQGRVIWQKQRVGRRKERSIVHLAENDYHFSEREALKVSEHKILKYILKNKRKKVGSSDDWERAV